MADMFPASRRTKVLRIVLAISLAINLAVAGLAIGVMMRDQGGRPPRDFNMSFGPVGKALAPDDRAAIREALRSAPDLPPPPPRGTAALSGLINALTAEPYDAQALHAAILEPADRLVKVQAVAAQALADRIDAMTPQERQTLAARLDSHNKR